jgi:sugar (pentulose or hexulose) kinase
MKIALGWLGRSGATAIGFLAVLAGCSDAAMAHFGLPEMDPGSMANALLLLGGGLLIVTGRRPRK